MKEFLRTPRAQLVRAVARHHTTIPNRDSIAETLGRVELQWLLTAIGWDDENSYTISQWRAFVRDVIQQWHRS